MKKGFLISFLTLVSSLLFSITAFAGDINSAEQNIINAISGTYEYDGAYYRVSDGYISQVTAYLNRDNVDLTESQADKYISQFYANFATGIASGYLVKIGDVPTSDSDSEDSESDGDSEKSGLDGNSEESTSDDNGSNEGTVEVGGIEVTDKITLIEVGEAEDNTIGSTSDEAVEYTVLELDEETMYVWGVDTLDVHKEAYKVSDILGTLAKGDAVTVTGSATTGWAQIKYNGEIGYVSAAYLRTQGYMDSMETEIETQPDNMDDAAETADESQEKEENVKDYSNAAPVAKSINLGVLALVVVIVFAIASGVVVLWHRNKTNKMKKR